MQLFPNFAVIRNPALIGDLAFIRHPAFIRSFVVTATCVVSGF